MNLSTEEQVREYYGQDVKKTEDLRTTACCVLGETSSDVRSLLKKVHPDVTSAFYGCGSPLPPLLTGQTVLDLGCGTGRDSYVAAQLVGESGKVIGVDMTEEQLEVAERTEDWHAKAFGYSKPNTLFVHGQIDNLKRCGIADASVDGEFWLLQSGRVLCCDFQSLPCLCARSAVVISNCVVNLVKDKLVVLKEIYRVLKPGGELYFSDVYCRGHIPEAAKKDKVAWGECLSGALDKADFRRLMAEVGFTCYWTTTSRVISVDDPEIKALLGNEVVFYSETIRAIKPATGLSYQVPTVEAPFGVDFGESVVYKGTVHGYPHAFSLGIESEIFVTGVKTSVDHNTAIAIKSSRYAQAFEFSSGVGASRGPWKPAKVWLAEGGPSMPFVASIGMQDGSLADGSAGACCPPAASGSGSKKCC
jgi:arsenite methyltransferase